MKNIAKLIALFALLLASAAAQAQADITLYHMRDLPLNNRLNPAFQPKNGSIYINIPAIPFIGAPTSLDVSLTGKNITFGGALGSANEMNDLGLGGIFTGKLDYEKIATSPGEFAAAKFNFGYTPISFGFMVKDMYFSLDVNAKVYTEGRLPKDIMRFLWYGNGDEETIGEKMSMNGLGATAYAYGELALGFSKEITQLDLIVGGKLKYLQGLGYAQLSLGEGSQIHTNPDNYHITVGVNPEMYMAGIPGEIPSGEVTLDSVVNGMEFGFDGYKFQTDNRGFAIDIGGTWNVGNVLDQAWAKNLEVSASLIDVGFIGWKGNKVVRSQYADDFTFEGISFSTDGENSSDFAQTLQDSIMSMAKVEAAGNSSFRKWLSPTLYVGANYHIAKYLNAGMLVGCRFDTYENLPLFAASVNTQNLPVNASLSASYFDGRGNLGFGIIFGRRGCQFHIITDNILAAANYQNAQAVNLRMGMNVLVGKTREKRKEAAAAGGNGGGVLAPEAKPGEALNPVQQEGATGAKVDGNNATVETKGNTESDEKLLKRALEEEKAETGATPQAAAPANAAPTAEQKSEPSAEELLKRAMEEEKAEGSTVKP